MTTFDPRMFRVNDVHNRLKPVLDLSDRMKKVLPSPLWWLCDAHLTSAML